MARLNVRDRVQGGFWRALETVGVKDARSRWEAQSPFLQRAVPPLVIAALVLVLAWAAGVPPHPTLLALLAIVYVLYLLPPRARRIALPLTVLGIALAYPILWANELNGTNVLFEIPVFKAFPNMDTMVAIVIFAMMAIGLNIVVGYAGLLDLGYVAFYAIGAYTAAWFASPHFNSVDFEFGAIGVRTGSAGSTSRSGSSSSSRRDHHRRRRGAHRLADASTAGGLPRHRHARLRGDHPPGCIERRRRRNQRPSRYEDELQPHERRVRHQPGRPAGLRRLAVGQARVARQLHRRERLVRELRQPRLLVARSCSC